MTLTMMSSNDDKSDICQFFYQDLFNIVNIQYKYKIWCKMDKNVLRYSMFLQDFQKSPAQVGLNHNCYKKDILKECLYNFQAFLVKYGLSILGMI